MVEPLFRFSEQSAASFYTTTFSGPFAWILNPAGPPGFHSSDYRLSEFYTLDYGLQASVINDHAGYHRYEMNGLDGKTTADMYPKANVFTVGISFTMVMTSPNSAAEVIARVTQSAQTTVERGLHKLEFRAMSTLCRVNFPRRLRRCRPRFSARGRRVGRAVRGALFAVSFPTA
jgi:hypothetical protein